jgi:hypothetical protein
MDDTTEYDMFLEVLKPRNFFSGKVFDTSSITYNEMEVLKKTFQNADMSNIFYIFVLFYKIRGNYKVTQEEQFYNQSIFDLFRVKLFLQNFLIEKVNLENKMLTGIPDERMLMVNGYERLNAVSFLLSKIKLAEQFSTTPDVVGDWKYNKVFSYLIANKLYNDVQIDCQKQK